MYKIFELMKEHFYQQPKYKIFLEGIIDELVLRNAAYFKL